MQKDIISSIADIPAIEKEMATIKDGLTEIMGLITKLAEELSGLHSEMKKSN